MHARMSCSMLLQYYAIACYLGIAILTLSIVSVPRYTCIRVPVILEYGVDTQVAYAIEYGHTGTGIAISILIPTSTRVRTRVLTGTVRVGIDIVACYIVPVLPYLRYSSTGILAIRDHVHRTSWVIK